MTDDEALKVAIRVLRGEAIYTDLTEAAARLERLARFVEAAKEDYSREKPMLDCWPVAILEDRYSGVYSGGKWVAIARAECGCCDADLPVEKTKQLPAENDTRFSYVADQVLGGDFEVGEFGCWIPLIPWVAVGETPNEALANLYAKANRPQGEGDGR